MIDPRLVLIAIALAAVVWTGGQVVKGVKKVGHGVKVVACAIHLPVKCPKPEAGK